MLNKYPFSVQTGFLKFTQKKDLKQDQVLADLLKEDFGGDADSCFLPSITALQLT